MRKLMQQHEPNSRGRCVEDGGDGQKMDEWPVVARKQAHPWTIGSSIKPCLGKHHSAQKKSSRFQADKMSLWGKCTEMSSGCCLSACAVVAVLRLKPRTHQLQGSALTLSFHLPAVSGLTVKEDVLCAWGKEIPYVKLLPKRLIKPRLDVHCHLGRC